jgi:hypothetical protein
MHMQVRRELVRPRVGPWRGVQAEPRRLRDALQRNRCAVETLHTYANVTVCPGCAAARVLR